MKKKKSVTGRIILFQEERFRMIDDAGRSFLFDLSHKVPVTNEDLKKWIKAGARLAVTYEGEPETETGVARSIKKAA